MSDVLLWAFLQNYHLDKSNAAVHCAPVKFSPLTFRLYHEMSERWPADEDIPAEMAEVRFHVNTYDLDPGR
jgi:hypothetical protein